MPSPPKKALPVLIIPGFMSSGLEVKKSDAKSYVGKRVWININSLGFSSMYRGSALDRNASIKGEEAFSEEMHKDYEKEYRAKSKWLNHMSLSNDMITERPGIEVRPIQGLKGVDYLTPGALTNHVSYVFGPLIRALQEVGYTDDNLDAAPYDWRLPPSELEKRDQYFSRTLRQVEDMYRRNDNTAVVLLCHSLGCKTGHYFLNFVKDHPKGGDTWLKKYIHAYMPVGAPHLGAPKALRALVDGDKMGLDTFLSDEEGLILGRSLGSGPWLAPRVLPLEAPPVVFIRKEGVLEITVPPIDCNDLVRERKTSPPKLRLAVVFGKDIIMSEFQAPTNDRGKLIYSFPGIFTFSTPAKIPAGKDAEGLLQFVLQEQGLSKTQAQKEKSLYQSPVCCPLRCVVNILLCPIKYILCLPCTLAGCIVCKTLEVTRDVTLAGANLTAAALGAGTSVGACQQFALSSVLTNKKRGSQVKAALLHVSDAPDVFKSRRKASISATLKWTPPKELIKPVMRQMSPVALLPKGAAYTLTVKHNKKKHVQYDMTDGCELLVNEGMAKTLNFVHDRYEKDSIGPRTRSATDAPPVSRVFAVFGVNCPSTEVGAVYRRRSLLVQDNHRVEKLHTLDPSARLLSNNGGLSLKGGVLLETGEGEEGKSGDGTVPYWSMNHCRNWSTAACNVKVKEVQGADHREILADQRFHKIVIHYVTGKEETTVDTK